MKETKGVCNPGGVATSNELRIKKTDVFCCVIAERRKNEMPYM